MRSASTTGIKLDLKQPDHDVLHAALELIDGRLPEDRLWFNATIESLGEPGFRELARTTHSYPAMPDRLPRAARVQRPGVCEGAA